MKSRTYGKYKMVEINSKRSVLMIDIDGLFHLKDCQTRLKNVSILY